MEASHREANLFWIRNTVFLGVQTAGLIGIYTRMTSDKAFAPSLAERIGLAVFGLAACFLWFIVTSSGRRLNHGYFNDARALVALKTPLKDLRGWTCLDNVASKSVGKLRWHTTSTTAAMYCLILVFAAAWIAVAFTTSPPQNAATQPGQPAAMEAPSPAKPT